MSIGIFAIPDFCSLISPDTRTTSQLAKSYFQQLKFWKRGKPCSRQLRIPSSFMGGGELSLGAQCLHYVDAGSASSGQKRCDYGNRHQQEGGNDHGQRARHLHFSKIAAR
jgi:hypothetical protein